MRDASPAVQPTPLGWNVVSLSSEATYLTHVENPAMIIDGGRLLTYAN
jgi:hypothetical protein